MRSRKWLIVVMLSARLLNDWGISTKSLYTWKARLSAPAKDVRIDTGQTREIRRLKAELARVTEERDILTVYFARDVSLSVM